MIFTVHLMTDGTLSFKCKTKGEKRGIEITKVNIAHQLKQAGVDMNRIAQSTGLSLEDVEKL